VILAVNQTHMHTTMVLTAAQVRAFFEDADQMVILHLTVIKLQDEGIDDPDDLTDFTKDSLMQVAENLRKPGDRIPNPDPNAPQGSTIPRPSYVFGAKLQKRLLEACKLVRNVHLLLRISSMKLLSRILPSSGRH